MKLQNLGTLKFCYFISILSIIPLPHKDDFPKEVPARATFTSKVNRYRLTTTISRKSSNHDDQDRSAIFTNAQLGVSSRVSCNFRCNDQQLIRSMADTDNVWQEQKKKKEKKESWSIDRFPCRLLSRRLWIL